MDLEDLRAAQSRERATDGLQELRDSFYEDVAAYIQNLKDQRDARAAELEDPFGDPRVQELNDEIDTAEQVAEAIYERRMGKLVKQASLAAADMTSGHEGLTQEEKSLFRDLVARIRENKSHVLDVITGEKKPPAPPQDDHETGQETPKPVPKESSAAAAMGDDLDPGDGAQSEADIARAVADGPDAAADESDAGDDGDGVDEHETDGVERTTVRITKDVGDIFGMDGREYSLAVDDVVTLPTENAAPLVERDAAEKLEN